MNELISVVVPIYKVEKYLKRCVDSILSQTYSNLEIILVDDGSPDNCGIMCDYYSSVDKRIVVIHKDNGGLSDARNVAIKHANGIYITFVDSDDYIDKDYVQYLYNLIFKYKADISICEFNYITESKKRINHPIENQKEIVMNQKTAVKRLLEQKLYSNSSSGKLFKTCDFKDIEYPYGKLYEDTLTIYKLFLKANTIVFGAKPLYFYLYRATSISKMSFNNKQMECIYNTEIMLNDILKKYPSLKTAGKCRLIDPCVGMLKKVSKEQNPNEYKTIIDKIYNIRISILFSKDATLKRRIWAALTFLGENNFVQIMRKW